MKRALSVFLAICMAISVISVSAVAFGASGFDYGVPYAKAPPVIDGKGTEQVWQKSYTFNLNPAAAIANGGYTSVPSNIENVASAEVCVLWSDGGLYLKWVVTDPTQSFALDLPQSDGLNTMDCVQVFLDPFNKKSTTVKDCAFCFDFVPYTAQLGSGVGQVPVGRASWFEEWVWIGLNNSIGVQMSATLDSRPDDDNDGLDRLILVSGYTIEAYIPWAAMELNGALPTIVPGKTQMGLGFGLVDYNYDHQKYLENDYSAAASKVFCNFCSDFGKGENSLRPSNYKTVALLAENPLGDVDENGYIDISDAILLFKYIAGKASIAESGMDFADIDKDAKVTLSDAIKLFKHIAGKTEL